MISSIGGPGRTRVCRERTPNIVHVMFLSRATPRCDEQQNPGDTMQPVTELAPDAQLSTGRSHAGGAQGCLDGAPRGSLHNKVCALVRCIALREKAMARIKHIALVTDDPAKTAEFYKQHFGLTELYRRTTDTGEKGVWLSDGYIYFAILKYGTGDAPKL